MLGSLGAVALLHVLGNLFVTLLDHAPADGPERQVKPAIEMTLDNGAHLLFAAGL
jgi:hypothetical protein